MRRCGILIVLAIFINLQDPAYAACLASSAYMSNIIDLGEEIVEVNDVFIPNGFDENDRIEVMVSGYLPNPCYRKPFAVIEKVGNNIRLTVKAVRFLDRSHLCIEMAVPFLISIPVGQTPKGNYHVTVNANTDSPQYAAMAIKESNPNSNAIDDFLYANVESVSVNRETGLVTLQGENPSPCFELDHIASTSNGINTYALLPIMRKNEAIECTREPTEFEYRFQLSNDLHARNILVHVRTLEGESKNKIYTPLH